VRYLEELFMLPTLDATNKMGIKTYRANMSGRLILSRDVLTRDKTLFFMVQDIAMNGKSNADRYVRIPLIEVSSGIVLMPRNKDKIGEIQKSTCSLYVLEMSFARETDPLEIEKYAPTIKNVHSRENDRSFLFFSGNKRSLMGATI